VLPADRAWLGRAVANLLDDDLKHTTGSARIHVAVEVPNGNAVILVEDSGPGIAPGDRRRVFERFVRLDAARGSGGVGLGLSIARMVARLHGGELEVAPSPLGGAAFRLTLAPQRAADGTRPG
jgi:signal transduction histidine kinase